MANKRRWGVSYGLKGNFHRRAELSSNLGEEKLGRGGFFLFLFFFSKAYLADVLTHTHTHTQPYNNLPSLAYKIGLSSICSLRPKSFKGLEMDTKHN